MSEEIVTVSTAMSFDELLIIRQKANEALEAHNLKLREMATAEINSLNAEKAEEKKPIQDKIDELNDSLLTIESGYSDRLKIIVDKYKEHGIILAQHVEHGMSETRRDAVSPDSEAMRQNLVGILKRNYGIAVESNAVYTEANCLAVRARSLLKKFVDDGSIIKAGDGPKATMTWIGTV
jgi:hypothetical protein